MSRSTRGKSLAVSPSSLTIFCVTAYSVELATLGAMPTSMRMVGRSSLLTTPWFLWSYRWNMSHSRGKSEVNSFTRVLFSWKAFAMVISRSRRIISSLARRRWMNSWNSSKVRAASASPSQLLKIATISASSSSLCVFMPSFDSIKSLVSAISSVPLSSTSASWKSCMDSIDCSSRSFSLTACTSLRKLSKVTLKTEGRLSTRHGSLSPLLATAMRATCSFRISLISAFSSRVRGCSPMSASRLLISVRSRLPLRPGS
mmetsp:Transcript_69699/g.179698  ORF Transcript_69699/g.179698 Transcript_69699/m.179698 type:complete len:258 (-) Transcript_69699:1322-2095(-)